MLQSAILQLTILQAAPPPQKKRRKKEKEKKRAHSIKLSSPAVTLMFDQTTVNSGSVFVEKYNLV